MSLTRTQARFVILPGAAQKDVELLAMRHVAFDPTRRRLVLQSDSDFPPSALSSLDTDIADPAAVVLKPDGSLAVVLDIRHALSAAWIEDAFVCALRS